jgi:hypothetical protein
MNTDGRGFNRHERAQRNAKSLATDERKWTLILDFRLLPSHFPSNQLGLEQNLRLRLGEQS